MSGPSAILFDGTTDNMLRGGALTGVVDSKQGIFSCWIRLDSGSDGVQTRVLSSTGDKIVIFKKTSNDFFVQLLNSVSTIILQFSTVSSFTESAAYLHFLTSWDLETGQHELYIDDVSEMLTLTPPANEDIDYTVSNYAIGSATGGTQKWAGAMADFYFAPGQFLDLTVEANRRKFSDQPGNPVFLGDSGERPTGTTPAIYLRGDQTNQGINSGDGGDFVSQGTQVPGETEGPGEYAGPIASGRILDTNILEVTSVPGNESVSPPFRIGGRGWDVQFKVPEALAGIEVSNDKLNWLTATDAFGNPLTSLSSSTFPVGQRPQWMRFIVATDPSSPRTFTSIAAYRKMTV